MNRNLIDSLVQHALTECEEWCGTPELNAVELICETVMPALQAVLAALRVPEGPVDRLLEACLLYDRWYGGEVPTLDGSGIAYELVSAIRQALRVAHPRAPEETQTERQP